MKISVSRNCPLSPDKLFATLKKSLKEDYYQNTNQELAEEAVKEGLSYVKYFGKNKQNSVNVTISACVEPNLYEATFRSNRGLQRVAYHLSQKEDKQTELTLFQETEPKTSVQALNERVLLFFFKKGLKRQLDAQLGALINATKI